MKAYKAFNTDLTCTRGNGTYQYRAGETYFTEQSQTARTGFHCCENPVDCLTWYPLPLGETGRIFIVYAEGDIDEIEDKIACTQITIGKELNLRGLVLEACKYIIRHPARTYKNRGIRYEIGEDLAIAEEDGFAIARGVKPTVKGRAGSVVAVLVENPENPNEFVDAKIASVGIDIEPDTWYTVQEGTWEVDKNEKKVS